MGLCCAAQQHCSALFQQPLHSPQSVCVSLGLQCCVCLGMHGYAVRFVVLYGSLAAMFMLPTQCRWHTAFKLTCPSMGPRCAQHMRATLLNLPDELLSDLKAASLAHVTDPRRAAFLNMQLKPLHPALHCEVTRTHIARNNGFCRLVTRRRWHACSRRAVHQSWRPCRR